MKVRSEVVENGELATALGELLQFKLHLVQGLLETVDDLAALECRLLP